MRDSFVKVSLTAEEKSALERMCREKGHKLSYGIRILALEAYREYMKKGEI